MAVFYPNLETIKKLRQKPTEGELHALDVLGKALSDEYEVFFQPFINGDIPDIVVMRKGGGVIIVEVKDWDLRHYTIDEKRNWHVNVGGRDRHPIKSPVKQVLNYKENLFNLHVEGLLEKQIQNFKMLNIVNCVVYFHNASTQELNDFVKTKFQKDERDSQHWNKYLGYLSYFDLLGINTFTEGNIQSIMEKRWVSKKSYLFDQELYESFKRCFSPSTHTSEQGIRITYSKEQEKIIESRAGSWQKVKGVAGSGKTLCLAKRAVNAHLRHGGNVLILTFNITLRNYIRDKISEVREGFDWKYFHIIHYHQFFSNMANNHSRPILSFDSWENTSFFEIVKDAIDQYDTILVDEIQDYQKPWVELVLKYFLNAESSEYVAYGDEKQNIYQRVFDDQEKKPFTKIGGQWNLLKKSYRVSNKIGRLAELFQKHFFDGRYEFDEILTQGDLFDQSEIGYHNFQAFSADEIFRIYRKVAKKYGLHDNDICIQSASVEPLRLIDEHISTTSSQKTNTMFESQETYLEILKNRKLSNEQFKKDYKAIRKKMKEGESINDEEEKILKNVKLVKNDIYKVRRSKKFNYWDNRGLLKLSTVHSFKGWEVDTLILLITNDEESSGLNEESIDPASESDEGFNSEELIYTAITRCRKNLFVVNFGNQAFDSFFTKHIHQFQ
ncbi:nuclease-related domain-containing DEAD/DEAH box helicase [Algoriphagus terrigena]|uniref:nuclease-related domain-containing DEAD/DEAH box helicase n=1 Tax=Algoriphagus terrigena TaxID=344884 RepID=UPI0004074D7D|nr:NERD domain-containing protein/DEAD/DEAH box helicase [Algoriphagus terrigena]